MPEVTEQEMVKCYGTKRIVNKKDQCERRAKKECPWGEFCASRANEASDDIHYGMANVSVGLMFADFNNLDKQEDKSIYSVFEQNGDVQPEFDFDAEDEPNKEPEYMEVDNIRIPEENRQFVTEIIERIASMYFDNPLSFECLMRKIFKEQNQSSVARQKGVSRQSINKRLLQDLGIAQKRNDMQARRDEELQKRLNELNVLEDKRLTQIENMKSMTPLEIKIYQICAIDGCLSITSISKQAKCARLSVYRTIENLEKKYGIKIRPVQWSRKEFDKHNKNDNQNEEDNPHVQ